MTKIVALVLAWLLLSVSQISHAVVPPAPVVIPLAIWDESMDPYRAIKKQKTTEKSKPDHIKIGIVAHPEGCPRVRFCGCGVSDKVFGRKIRSLYLAANWLKFPRTEPAPGMVAARRGHVFYIMKVVGKNKVLAYDPNSGGHKTRVHIRSLAGFRVVNPRA